MIKGLGYDYQPIEGSFLKISIIAAMAKNRVIGRQNQLPWRLPADLSHFKGLTVGKTIVMGRKTFDSIGRALPHRRNIVLTRDTQFSAPGCEVFHDFEAVLQLSDIDEMMVIGGAQLYQLALPLADRLYITLIDRDFEGDVFFPDWDEGQWQQTACETHHDDEQDFDYRFLAFEKKGEFAIISEDQPE